MKKTILFLFATAVFFTASAQNGRVTTELDATIVTSEAGLKQIRNYPQGYETCVDIDGDGQIDPNTFTWGTIMVETADYAPMPAIFSFNDVRLLHSGGTVRIKLIKKGPRYGCQGLRPRENNRGSLPQGEAGIKAKVLLVN